VPGAERLLGLALLAVAAAAQAQQRPVDVLLRGGTVCDGSGGPCRAADVAVLGERITFVGDARRAGVRAGRPLDVAGLVVAPGFIDPHTHTLEDLSDTGRRRMEGYLLQGVTTVVAGNDGGGPFAVAGVLEQWRRGRIGTNAALLVGQGTVRRQVLGMADRAPSPAELDSMRALVRRGMREGGLGLSTGLYYAPGSYAATEEVIALAREAAAAGGLYDSHLRDESSYSIGLVAAVAEALRIGREAGLPVHIAHIKALGTDVWGRSDSVIALIRAARAAGRQVDADQYPYDASGTSIGASLLPRWAEAGGRDSLLARTADPATLGRLRADMTENLRRRGGAGAMLITGAGGRSGLVGKTLEAIAREQGHDPITAALDIIRHGDASAASFNMQEADIERFMREEFVETGSDGSDGHPRKYGTFPRKYRRYVAGRGVITLARFIQASSSQTAETFGLKDRGRVREGFFADLVVLDTARYRDRATYQAPRLVAEGVRYLLVNGVLAILDGRPTGALVGRPLRRKE